MNRQDQHQIDASYMSIAAALAARGHGGAEPNPLVGCLIVSPTRSIVGWGYHRYFGRAHAEINALKRAGGLARGATAYLTLEPCNHTGKTPPCTKALINAGIARLVIARRDPNPIAAGGVDRMRAAGIQVDTLPDHEQAVATSDPFVHRVRSGLPWVIAKWAQTLDGRIATRTGESQWISSQASRRLVHRERGRVDAILTGVGTILADDPMFTARNVRIRRIARRVVIDPKLDTPPDAKIVATAHDTPTMIACDEATLSSSPDLAEKLIASGVELLPSPRVEGELPIAPLLRHLVDEYDATNVMVEAGAGLLGRLFRQKLIKEAWVFVAPLLLGDEHATPPVAGLETPRLADGVKLKLSSSRIRDGDLVLRYRVL